MVYFNFDKRLVIMDERKLFGDKGEKLACEYLEKKGYKILETNWYHNKKEIDIICLKNNELVIVEVKTRKTDFFGKPEDAVTMKKQNFLIEAAQNYIEQNNINLDTRFDVISIILNAKQKSIKHIKGAFNPNFY